MQFLLEHTLHYCVCVCVRVRVRVRVRACVLVCVHAYMYAYICMCYCGSRFLTISHNRIKKIENLLYLTSLQVLDLSHNKIDQLEEGRSRHDYILHSSSLFLQSVNVTNRILIGI